MSTEYFNKSIIARRIDTANDNYMCWTHEELAKEAGVPLDMLEDIYDKESHAVPTIETVLRIADALVVDVDYLVKKDRKSQTLYEPKELASYILDAVAECENALENLVSVVEEYKKGAKNG